MRCTICNDDSASLSALETKVTIGALTKVITAAEMLCVFNLPAYTTKSIQLCGACLEALTVAFRFHKQCVDALEALQCSHPAHCEKPEVQLEQLTCDACNLPFDSDLSLAKHRKLIHPSAKPVYCALCRKTFKTFRGLQQHRSFYHNTGEPIVCEQCQRSFITRHHYEAHIRHHRRAICGFCLSGWPSDNQLLEHVRAKHLNRLFVCSHCEHRSLSRKSLMRHLRVVHQLPSVAGRTNYYCGPCGTVDIYDGIEELLEHLEQHHAADNGVNNSTPYEEFLTEPFFPVDDDTERRIDVEEQEHFLRNFNLVRLDKHLSGVAPTAVGARKMILEEFLDEAFENDQIWTKYIEGGEEYLIDNYDIYLEGADGTGIGDIRSIGSVDDGTFSCIGNGTNGSRLVNSCNFRCPKCAEGFQRQYQLTVHLAEAHEVPSLVCDDCGAQFTSLKSYRTHRQEHLKENIRFRESNIPEAEEALSLVQSGPRDYFLQEATTNYQFICKLCDRVFLRKYNLEKHRCGFYKRYATAHVNRCPLCPFETSSPQDWQAHQKSHQQIPTAQDSVYCTLCDRRFGSISGLKYHLKTHTGMKAFTCLYCPKRFTGSSNLNAHIRNVHSEHKAYRCAECNESFASKDHLNKHQRSRHRQERPFSCGDCGKSYFQRSHLNDHITACHGELRFVCQRCNSSYGCRSSLKRHLLQKHAVK